MTNCLKTLRFWKKKDRSGHPTSTYVEKSNSASRAVAGQAAYHEKPAHHVEIAQHASTLGPAGIPIRPNVNPAYSAYSTPADPRWADAATSACATAISSLSAKDEGSADDVEEAARRKKAEQEEQERLDFFQMM